MYVGHWKTRFGRTNHLGPIALRAYSDNMQFMCFKTALIHFQSIFNAFLVNTNWYSSSASKTTIEQGQLPIFSPFDQFTGVLQRKKQWKSDDGMQTALDPLPPFNSQGCQREGQPTLLWQAQVSQIPPPEPGPQTTCPAVCPACSWSSLHCSVNTAALLLWL